MNGLPEVLRAEIVGEAFKTHAELEFRFVEKKIGSVVIAQALEQQEMEIGAHEILTDEEAVLLDNLDHAEAEYGRDIRDSNTPLGLLDKANGEFIIRASRLFGEINGYRLGPVHEGSFGIRSGGMFDETGETDLYLHVSDGVVSFSKELRWINPDTNKSGRVDLEVTDDDKKVLAQAVNRLISIDQQLQTEI